MSAAHREKLFLLWRTLSAPASCAHSLRSNRDGSFLTEKPRPADVDAKVYISEEALFKLADEQLIVYNAIKRLRHYFCGRVQLM